MAIDSRLRSRSVFRNPLLLVKVTNKNFAFCLIRLAGRAPALCISVEQGPAKQWRDQSKGKGARPQLPRSAKCSMRNKRGGGPLGKDCGQLELL
ncbi:hypothetical protein chiPu_0001754 [Chiloscyllium punctatum]|uniref:Uncharacterized protein n=1 Tax=Chiloscyllium punctatum TaxID=137246 RepID=A0A401RZ47_CHIPU|nr:hypothetical protein [Chiloscyllium punctatum]